LQSQNVAITYPKKMRILYKLLNYLE